MTRQQGHRVGVGGLGMTKNSEEAGSCLLIWLQSHWIYVEIFAMLKVEKYKVGFAVTNLQPWTFKGPLCNIYRHLWAENTIKYTHLCIKLFKTAEK